MLGAFSVSRVLLVRVFASLLALFILLKCIVACFCIFCHMLRMLILAGLSGQVNVGQVKLPCRSPRCCSRSLPSEYPF